jgi:hypothetical protein
VTKSLGMEIYCRESMRRPECQDVVYARETESGLFEISGWRYGLKGKAVPFVTQVTDKCLLSDSNH